VKRLALDKRDANGKLLNAENLGQQPLD